jgi:hypothetical protein
MPRFRIIANSFTIGNLQEFRGPVIASPDAIILVMDYSPLDNVRVTCLQFGIPILGTVVRLLNKVRRPTQIDYADLPAEITSHPDWPIKRKHVPVILIPASCVDRLEIAYFGAPLEIRCDSIVYRASVGLLRNASVIRFLRSTGWGAKMPDKRLAWWRQYGPAVTTVAGAAIGVVIGIALRLPNTGGLSIPMMIVYCAPIGFLVGRLSIVPFANK